MNLRILINEKETGQVVVNTSSEEKATQVYKHFNSLDENDVLSFEEINNVTIPSMFSNCIFDESQLK